MRSNFFTKLGAILTGVLLLGVALFFGAFFLSFPVKWLWNYVVPTVFGLPEISYWQAVALFILCGLLFKGNTNTTTKQ